MEGQKQKFSGDYSVQPKVKARKGISSLPHSPPPTPVREPAEHQLMF